MNYRGAQSRFLFRSKAFLSWDSGGLSLAILLAGIACFSTRASAHPASGIVADSQGRIYFADAARGVYLIDNHGALHHFSAVNEHWMVLDIAGRFSRIATSPTSETPFFRITPDGARPAILLSSGVPITIGTDGALYFAPYSKEGPLEIKKRTPDHDVVLARIAASADGGPLHWLNGIAAGLDGSIYFSENDAVRKVSSDGSISTVAGPLMKTTGRSVPGIGPHLGPDLRGLTVDRNGNVWVAATGECALLKITPAGEVTTVLTTDSPWSPTGVAMFGDDLFSLEYRHTATDNRLDWIPRVRKRTADGRISTIAALNDTKRP